jgi:hypothetical protein
MTRTNIRISLNITKRRQGQVRIQCYSGNKHKLYYYIVELLNMELTPYWHGRLPRQDFTVYMWDLRFSQQWFWRVLSTGIQCRVVCWKSTDVLEEHVAPIFMVKESCSSWFLAWLILWPWRWRRWHVPPKCRSTFNTLHGVISQKIELFIACTYCERFKSWM